MPSVILPVPVATPSATGATDFTRVREVSLARQIDTLLFLTPANGGTRNYNIVFFCRSGPVRRGRSARTRLQASPTSRQVFDTFAFSTVRPQALI